MKTIGGTALVLLLVLTSACAQKVNDPADVQAIKKSMEDYAKAVNARDIDATVALMSDNAMYAGLNSPVATGKEAIRSMHTAWFSLTPEFSCPVEDVRVVGDHAAARGNWTAKYPPKAQGLSPYSDSGSWVVVLARQSDSSWRWDWCLPNSNQPLPGSTASGEDEQAIFQLERDWVAAGPKKDTAAVDKVLASEYVFNANGQIQNRKQFLAAIKANPAKIESAANSEMKAMVFGDTAVVHCLYSEKSTLNGKDTSRTDRYTDIWIKRDGRWQAAISYSPKLQ